MPDKPLRRSRLYSPLRSLTTWANSQRVKSPYSKSDSEILRKRFPQPSPRRAAVKISVEVLRMKFSAGCLQWQPAGVPRLRV
jgi:hypothetical protein